LHGAKRLLRGAYKNNAATSHEFIKILTGCSNVLSESALQRVFRQIDQLAQFLSHAPTNAVIGVIDGLLTHAQFLGDVPGGLAFHQNTPEGEPSSLFHACADDLQCTPFQTI
jgi:hypothetical protein